MNKFLIFIFRRQDTPFSYGRSLSLNIPATMQILREERLRADEEDRRV